MKLPGLFSGCAIVGAAGIVVGILAVLVFAAGMILDVVGEGGFVVLLFMAFTPAALWLASWTYERFGIAHANIEAARIKSQAAAFIEPNTDGLLPVHMGLLQRPDFGAASISVHLARQSGRAQLPMLDAVANAPAPAQLTVSTPQSFWELYQAHKLPDSGFLMGYSLEDGQPVTADWGKLYSALIGGQSGSGKSTMIRSILAQSAMQGGRFVVLDKHYGAGDESLGESLQPLRHLMLCDVAASEQQMIDALAYVRNIGEQRLSGANHDKSPVILVVDETTAVLQRSATAESLQHVLGQIAQETRKVGVYAMCIGQNFNGRIMDTTVRDSFVSFISCRARKGVARTMTDNNEFGKMAQDLSIGQAVWMTPSGDVLRLAVPNCTQHDLDLVASHLETQGEDFAPLQVVTPSSKPSSKPSSNRLPPTIDVGSLEDGAEDTLDGAMEDGVEDGVNLGDSRIQNIRNLLILGYSQTEIIKEVWKIESASGRKYQEAAKELRLIIAELVK